jgi:Rhodopirellula transposase DDE domain
VFAIRSRAAWLSPPIAADRTDRMCDWGNLNCSAPPMNSHQLKCIICHAEPADGTRLVPATAGSSAACLFISQNWRAKPLLSYRVIVELFGATTTRAGLTVRCELDNKTYPNGIVVTDEVLRNLNIQHADCHSEWN